MGDNEKAKTDRFKSLFEWLQTVLETLQNVSDDLLRTKQATAGSAAASYVFPKPPVTMLELFLRFLLQRANCPPKVGLGMCACACAHVAAHMSIWRPPATHGIVVLFAFAFAFARPMLSGSLPAFLPARH
jgi:hypothetical protein